MNISTRDRSDLKSYFVSNSIPTQRNFEELIEGMLNQKDDGLVKLPNDPLSIKATGDEPQEAIRFYKDFADPASTWTLSLNARSDPNDPTTARAGLSISDGAGTSRLFIDEATGSVGVGTVTPQAKFEVQGGTSVLEQEEWHAAVLGNTWQNFGQGYNDAEYFKDSLNIVHLRGSVKSTVSGALAQNIFTLPEGYRPPARECFIVWTTGRAGRLDIYPDGGVRAGKNLRISWITLNGVTFRAT